MLSVPEKVMVVGAGTESLPKAYRSVLAPSWLSSNRGWKTAPEGCGIHRRIRVAAYIEARGWLCLQTKLVEFGRVLVFSCVLWRGVSVALIVVTRQALPCSRCIRSLLRVGKRERLGLTCE